MQWIQKNWRMITHRGNEREWKMTIVKLLIPCTFGKMIVWMLSLRGIRSVKIFSFPTYCFTSQSPNTSKCLGLVISRQAQTATSTENSKNFNIIFENCIRWIFWTILKKKKLCHFDRIYTVSKWKSTQKVVKNI